MPAALDILAQHRHRSRYYRWKKEGASIEKIAEQDGVGVDAVRKSLGIVQNYYSVYSEEELKRAQIGIIIQVAEQEMQSLMEALSATRQVVDDEGKEIEVPDHATRLKAMEIINDKMSALIPPARIDGSSFKVGVGVNVGQPQSAEVAPGERIVRFEDNVRAGMARRSSQRELAAPPEECRQDLTVELDEPEST